MPWGTGRRNVGRRNVGCVNVVRGLHRLQSTSDQCQESSEHARSRNEHQNAGLEVFDQLRAQFDE